MFVVFMGNLLKTQLVAHKGATKPQRRRQGQGYKAFFSLYSCIPASGASVSYPLILTRLEYTRFSSGVTRPVRVIFSA
jgi:hypothetical protein